MGQQFGGFRSAPTITRGRRCENCVHYDNGELAIQHYKAKRFEELKARADKIISENPTPAALRAVQLASASVGGKDRQTRNFDDLNHLMQALGVNYELGDTMMRQGLLGMCMVSAAPGDFVHKDYLCGDKGPSRYKSNIKIEGKDETAGEARSRLGLEDD
jgi:hypothetical protein